MIIGTVKNSVKLAMLDHLWQQKKSDTNIRKNADKVISDDERQLQLFQQQIQEINESKKPAMLDAKLESGAKLTAEEIEYLRKNNPQALKEYEELQRERENYRKQLRNCKSKEEVERLKLTKMGQCLSAAKKITSNACIPEEKKLELMKKLLKQVNGIEAEHLKFIESLQYAKLPEEERNRDEKNSAEVQEGEEAAILPGSPEGEEATITPGSSVLPEDVRDVKEKLQEMISTVIPEGNTVDVVVADNTPPGTVENGPAGGSIDLKL